MYELHFRRNYDTPKDYVRVGTRMYSTLESASKARVVSGDLVVDTYSGKVVANESWLFDWEKLNPACYARKAIRFDNSL